MALIKEAGLMTWEADKPEHFFEKLEIFYGISGLISVGGYGGKTGLANAGGEI